MHIYAVNGVRKTDIHAVEPLVAQPTTSEFQVAIGILNGINS
jgi:hypothetical protein